MKSYKEWILKAEHDLKIAFDEINTKDPVCDMICFHCQQAVEKLLKAFLIFHNKEISKTHDIADLIVRCMEIDKEFDEFFDKEIDSLTLYAVEMRYPGVLHFPSIDEAKDALNKAQYVKEFVMRKLEGEKLDGRG